MGGLRSPALNQRFHQTHVELPIGLDRGFDSSIVTVPFVGGINHMPRVGFGVDYEDIVAWVLHIDHEHAVRGELDGFVQNDAGVPPDGDGDGAGFGVVVPDQVIVMSVLLRER